FGYCKIGLWWNHGIRQGNGAASVTEFVVF
ncbi:MAG: hypothetical protein RIT07_449, partial [Bacteroidota bacterium]